MTNFPINKAAHAALMQRLAPFISASEYSTLFQTDPADDSFALQVMKIYLGSPDPLWVADTTISLLEVSPLVHFPKWVLRTGVILDSNHPTLAPKIQRATSLGIVVSVFQATELLRTDGLLASTNFEVELTRLMSKVIFSLSRHVMLVDTSDSDNKKCFGKISTLLKRYLKGDGVPYPDLHRARVAKFIDEVWANYDERCGPRQALPVGEEDGISLLGAELITQLFFARCSMLDYAGQMDMLGAFNGHHCRQDIDAAVDFSEKPDYHMGALVRGTVGEVHAIGAPNLVLNTGLGTGSEARYRVADLQQDPSLGIWTVKLQPSDVNEQILGEYPAALFELVDQHDPLE